MNSRSHLTKRAFLARFVLTLILVVCASLALAPTGAIAGGSGLFRAILQQSFGGTINAAGASDNDVLTFDSATATWSGSPAGAGDLMADGTVPLTADWNVGPFDLTLVDLNATNVLVGVAADAGWTGDLNSIDATDATTAATAGESFGITTGAGNTSGAGGAFAVTGGDGGATDTSVGGAITLITGSSAATNGDSGDFVARVGAETGSGTPGSVLLGDLNTEVIQIGNASIPSGGYEIVGTDIEINATVGGGGDGLLNLATLNVAGDTTTTGQIIAQSGTAANPSIAWAADDDGTGTGIFRPAGNQVGFSCNGVLVAQATQTTVIFPVGTNLGNGDLTSWRNEIENNTAGVGSPNILSTAESGKIFTNEGSTATNFHTLPVPAPGDTQYWFWSIDTSDVMRIVAQAGDTITLNGVTSSTAGFIESNTPGQFAALRMTSLDSTNWLCTEVHGSWNVDGVTALNTTGGTIASVGYQATATAVIATSDGLTTGLITSNTSVVTTTVATDADDIATLPVPVVGMQIRIYVGGTGHEVRTVAASNVTINNVDSDGTNELALAANTYITFECVSATAWVARGFDNVGADLAALVPDAS
jgi:hypothetical protein